MNGNEMYQLAERLFPINRSLTGDGVRQSLLVLKEYIPELQIHEVPSGTKAFDWIVPDEWNIREAYIENEDGKKIIDFADCNLHVIGYSEPIDKYVSYEELQKYLVVEDSRPNAIPYVTSYYQKRSGFCMSKNQRDGLKEGKYHLYIDSELKKGYMTYGEIIIPSTMEKNQNKEVFFYLYLPSVDGE